MIPRYLVNFDSRDLEIIKTDFLVIGSGIAGLYTALRASYYCQVMILTKKAVIDSNTGLAQGGIAAAIGLGDTYEEHKIDTLNAGAGLCNESAVEVLVREGSQRVLELIRLGVEFDRDNNNQIELTKEGAHGKRRILHAHGDATGEVIQDYLKNQIDGYNEDLSMHEEYYVVDLLVDQGRCCGALVYDWEHERYLIVQSKVTVAATGGAGQIYMHTTNPDVATADGVGFCYRAGAEIVDMEFIQFHPTALYLPGAPRHLISEAVRGEGAILLDKNGYRFMKDYHPLLELAPRDIVARSIKLQMAKTESDCVYLDLSPIEIDVKDRFPNIAQFCLEYGLDISKDMIPVSPAAHYCMGGIKTDTWGRTSIQGLYSCGEAACQGIHGANRLASNSLLEGLVFGGRIAEKARDDVQQTDKELPVFVCSELKHASQVDIAGQLNRLRQTMWDEVSIFRNRESLTKATDLINEMMPYLEQELPGTKGIEFKNVLTAAMLICRAALLRTESRGGHFRSDFPETDPTWLKHIVQVRS